MIKLSQTEMNRYSRHILLNEVGAKGQEKLKNAKVLIVGAGGLGCPVLQYLAAAGVGTLGIVDFDVVDESNLQRQILFGNTSIGEFKAIAAKERLNELNPLVDVHTYPEKLDEHNALELFEIYDLIVDGTDNFAARYLINDASVITGKPLVYGSIYRFEGQVTVFNYKGGPSYRCLFPDPPEPNTVPNCAQIGVMGVLAGMIGTLQANEVIKIILEIGEILSGKLIISNALSNKRTTINIPRSEDQIKKVLEIKTKFEEQDYELFCEQAKSNGKMKEISANELRQRISQGDEMQFIDVREIHEEPKIQELNGICIPMSELLDSMDKIEKSKTVIVYCHSGIRSRIAIKSLQEKHHFNNLINLTGGVIAW